MSILYIGSNEVCFVNNSFSKVIYQANKDGVDYTKLTKLIEKDKNVVVFIKSFFSFTEHKTYSLGLSKKDIQTNINKRLEQQDLVCASYNYLFSNGKGGEHRNDIIFTIIKKTEEEKHIQKIFSNLLKTDLDLSKIYSFEQSINTIGASSSIFSTNINVNVIMTEKNSMIVVSNGDNYIFGRFIKKRENEEILLTTANMLATTVKYISTTYSFLHNEVKITIMSKDRCDIDQIRAVDNVFESIKINTQILKMPVIKIEKDIPSIADELKLIKLSIGNLKKVNTLTNGALSYQIHSHKKIIFLKYISILMFVAMIAYSAMKIITGTKLSTDDQRIDKQYDLVVKNIKVEEKKISKLDKNVYAILATEIAKNVNNNNHIEAIKDVSKVFERHRGLIFVESYRFNCDDCISKDRKNTLYVDIALFNVNSLARFAIKKLEELEQDLRQTLSKKYNHVDIVYQQLSKEKRLASTRDVRDTMIITFYNDNK